MKRGRILFTFCFIAIYSHIYRTQNNCELAKRHSKRGKNMERARGEHDGQESV
jgi:cbb3-type cytochrome oxidase subunit 3